MENDLNLIYYHRISGDPYRVKRITKDDYVIEYPETSERVMVTKRFLDKGWVADKENGKKQKKHRLDFTRREREIEF
jgi:hypothetical protein